MFQRRGVFTRNAIRGRHPNLQRNNKVITKTRSDTDDRTKNERYCKTDRDSIQSHASDPIVPDRVDIDIGYPGPKCMLISMTSESNDIKPISPITEEPSSAHQDRKLCPVYHRPDCTRARHFVNDKAVRINELVYNKENRTNYFCNKRGHLEGDHTEVYCMSHTPQYNNFPENCKNTSIVVHKNILPSETCTCSNPNFGHVDTEKVSTKFNKFRVPDKSQGHRDKVDKQLTNTKFCTRGSTKSECPNKQYIKPNLPNYLSSDIIQIPEHKRSDFESEAGYRNEESSSFSSYTDYPITDASSTTIIHAVKKDIRPRPVLRTGIKQNIRNCSSYDLLNKNLKSEPILWENVINREEEEEEEYSVIQDSCSSFDEVGVNTSINYIQVPRVTKNKICQVSETSIDRHFLHSEGACDLYFKKNSQQIIVRNCTTKLHNNKIYPDLEWKSFHKEAADETASFMSHKSNTLHIDYPQGNEQLDSLRSKGSKVRINTDPILCDDIAKTNEERNNCICLPMLKSELSVKNNTISNQNSTINPHKMLSSDSGIHSLNAADTRKNTLQKGDNSKKKDTPKEEVNILYEIEESASHVTCTNEKDDIQRKSRQNRESRNFSFVGQEDRQQKHTDTKKYLAPMKRDRPKRNTVPQKAHNNYGGDNIKSSTSPRSVPKTDNIKTTTLASSVPKTTCRSKEKYSHRRPCMGQQRRQTSQCTSNSSRSSKSEATTVDEPFVKEEGPTWLPDSRCKSSSNHPPSDPSASNDFFMPLTSNSIYGPTIDDTLLKTLESIPHMWLGRENYSQELIDTPEKVKKHESECTINFNEDDNKSITPQSSEKHKSQEQKECQNSQRHSMKRYSSRSSESSIEEPQCICETNSLQSHDNKSHKESNSIPQRNEATCTCDSLKVNESHSNISRSLNPLENCQIDGLAEVIGPTLDEVVLSCIDLISSNGGSGKLSRVSNKTTKKCDQESADFLNPKNHTQIDIVRWLHDEYLVLAEDILISRKVSFPTNGVLNKDRLEARQYVLDNLADLLDRKKILEETSSAQSGTSKKSDSQESTVYKTEESTKTIPCDEKSNNVKAIKGRTSFQGQGARGDSKTYEALKTCKNQRITIKENKRDDNNDTDEYDDDDDDSWEDISQQSIPSVRKRKSGGINTRKNTSTSSFSTGRSTSDVSVQKSRHCTCTLQNENVTQAFNINLENFLPTKNLILGSSIDDAIFNFLSAMQGDSLPSEKSSPIKDKSSCSKMLHKKKCQCFKKKCQCKRKCQCSYNKSNLYPSKSESEVSCLKRSNHSIQRSYSDKSTRITDSSHNEHPRSCAKSTCTSKHGEDLSLTTKCTLITNTHQGDPSFCTEITCSNSDISATSRGPVCAQISRGKLAICDKISKAELPVCINSSSEKLPICGESLRGSSVCSKGSQQEQLSVCAKSLRGSAICSRSSRSSQPEKLICSENLNSTVSICGDAKLTICGDKKLSVCEEISPEQLPPCAESICGELPVCSKISPEELSVCGESICGSPVSISQEDELPVCGERVCGETVEYKILRRRRLPICRRIAYRSLPICISAPPSESSCKCTVSEVPVAICTNKKLSESLCNRLCTAANIQLKRSAIPCPLKCVKFCTTRRNTTTCEQKPGHRRIVLCPTARLPSRAQRTGGRVCGGGYDVRNDGLPPVNINRIMYCKMGTEFCALHHRAETSDDSGVEECVWSVEEARKHNPTFEFAYGKSNCDCPSDTRRSPPPKKVNTTQSRTRTTKNSRTDRNQQCNNAQNQQNKNVNDVQISKVLWAVTRINVFRDQSKTYEVMEASEQPPKEVPRTSEGVFVVIPRKKK